MRTRRRPHPLPRPTSALGLVGIVLFGVFAPPSVLAQRTDPSRLDAYIERAHADWPVPGLAVAIVRDGRTLLTKGYGVLEDGGQAPVDEHTLFAVASNTKAFTAAALAILVEEEKVSWDDPVRDHLPYFQLYNPFVSQDMRVRDLLCHRSGLGTFSGDLLWYGTTYSAEEVVRRTRFVPQEGAFRASYGYSNLMFIAAGEVIEAASGMAWSDFVRDRILDPLGMRRTVTSVSDLGSRENVATPHKNLADAIVPLTWYDWDAVAAAGGIISSVSEMAEWLQLQLNQGEHGGRRFFSQESSWEMWTVHTPQRVSPRLRRSMPSTHFRGYGLGWSLNDYLGRLIVSHGGGYDGMFSRVVLVPEEKLGIVVLTNSMTTISTAIANYIVDAFLGGEEQDWSRTMLDEFRTARGGFEARQTHLEEGRVQGTEPSLALDGYTGTFGGDMYGNATVSRESGGLVLRLLPNPDLVADLTHLHHDTFLLRWRETFAWFGQGTATFVLDSSGEVEEVRLNVPNDDFWFHELELRRRPG